MTMKYDPRAIKQQGLMVTVKETGELGFVRMGRESPQLDNVRDRNHPHFNRWKVEIVTDHYSLQPVMIGNEPLIKYLTPEEVESAGVKDDSGYLGRQGRDPKAI